MGLPQGSIVIQDDEIFTDALEEFPFFDPLSTSSSLSQLHGYNNGGDSTSKHTPSSSSSAGLRRRRQKTSKELPWPKTPDALLHGSLISARKNHKFLWNLKNNEKLNDKLNRTKVQVNHVDSGSNGKLLTDETNRSSSVITTVSDDDGRAINDSGSNFLFVLAGLAIKTIAFQTSLLVGFISFPLWFMYSSYMFLIDPFWIVKRGRRYVKKSISRFLRFCYGNLKWLLNLWMKRNRSTWKFCLQMGWGLLCSAFVGIVLVGLLVMGLVISGVLMRCILEKPLHKIEQLNFDYTKDTPMAFVPLMSCPDPLCFDCDEKIRIGDGAKKSRVIPLDHKLQATVSLTLPESYYNRNLGMFQVRVDFLSSKGKPLVSKLQPCMLPFKSKPVRLLSTVFKLGLLLTGYSSESQTLNIKFSGHTETQIPTSCLRVIMEPRAQFASRGGVPEIYTAYLKLESQLPFFKRILWSWKATIFVWTSMVIFTVGLLLILAIIVPCLWRPRGVNASQNSIQR